MFQGAWVLSTVAKLANSHVLNKKRYRAAWPSRADDDDDDGDNGTVDDNPAG
jgi:hypothetical protein